MKKSVWDKLCQLVLLVRGWRDLDVGRIDVDRVGSVFYLSSLHEGLADRLIG